MQASSSKKPFKIKDTERNIKKSVVAGSLQELRLKVAKKFEKVEELPAIHLDCDGTEIDDEEYFLTLEDNTELIAVFPGQHWIDPSHFLSAGERMDQTDSFEEEVDSKSARVRQIVGQLKHDLYNISVISDSDLDLLSNMDPNSLTDITGKEFVEQLKDSGRTFCAKREAKDRINLLKLLKEGAIFCSERYPEDSEDIEAEINKHFNNDTINYSTITETQTIAPVAPENKETIKEQNLQNPKHDHQQEVDVEIIKQEKQQYTQLQKQLSNDHTQATTTTTATTALNETNIFLNDRRTRATDT